MSAGIQAPSVCSSRFQPELYSCLSPEYLVETNKELSPKDLEGWSLNYDFGETGFAAGASVNPLCTALHTWGSASG